MKPLLGIIGAGSVSRFHIEAAKEAGFEVNSISASKNSISAKKLSKEYLIKNYFEETKVLLSSKSFDCLTVLTPPNVTISLLPELQQLQLPILVEKPVSLDSNSLSNFIDSRHIFVNFNRRYYETVSRFNALCQISNGIYSFSVIESIPNRTNLIDEIGFSILNNSIHMLDLLYFLCGDINLESTQYSEINQILNFKIFRKLKYIGTFTISFNALRNTAIEFEREQLNVKLSPLELLTKRNKMTVKPPDQEYAYNRYEFSYEETSESSSFKESGKLKPGFLGIYNDFLNFYKTRNISEKLPTLYDAQRSLYLAENIVEKYRSYLKKISIEL